jgi:hypothetical protein
MDERLLDPEYQQIILKRLPRVDEKSILDMLEEYNDSMICEEVLDTFVVKAMIIVANKVQQYSTENDSLAEYLIRQYSNRERLPIRLTILKLLS